MAVVDECGGDLMRGLNKIQRQYVEALLERDEYEEDSVDYDRINDDVLDPLWWLMTVQQAMQATNVYMLMRVRWR